MRRLCPVVGSWPDKDFTTGAAPTLENELTTAGVAHDLKIYPGTKHAFFNDQLKSYDAAAAEDSWQRILAFVAEHVKSRRRDSMKHASTDGSNPDALGSAP